MSEIKNHCRQIRIKTGWSQDELGFFLGLSISTIQRYEYGKSGPRQMLNSWVVAYVYRMTLQPESLKLLKSCETFEDLLVDL